MHWNKVPFKCSIKLFAKNSQFCMDFRKEIAKKVQNKAPIFKMKDIKVLCFCLLSNNEYICINGFKHHGIY